jgi:uncharacterized membrane protein YdfJ with MMPL/SSD domain
MTWRCDGHSVGSMLTLAKVSIKRPKSALAVWGVVALVLTLIGLGVSHNLSPSVTVVPGTQSSRAQQLADAQFGPTQLVPILLEGSKAQDARKPSPCQANAPRSPAPAMTRSQR